MFSRKLCLLCSLSLPLGLLGCGDDNDMSAPDAMAFDATADDAMASDATANDAMASDAMVDDATAEDAMASDAMASDAMASDGRPVCQNVGSRSEGWFEADGTLICFTRCDGAVVSCENIGSRSEGWYADLDTAGCPMAGRPRLIQYVAPPGCGM